MDKNDYSFHSSFVSKKEAGFFLPPLAAFAFRLARYEEAGARG